MKKFKTACLLTFFMFSFIELGFSQNVHFQKNLTTKDNLWYYGDALYSGEVITLNQDQIGTKYHVEKGVPSGLFTKYYWDNSFEKSNYKDTAEISRLNQEIIDENVKLSLLIKDSLLAFNDLISYINNEIGGEKKLQNLLGKNQENKLKEKQKVLIGEFVAKKTTLKNSAQNVLLSQQKIKLTNIKLKEEEAKSDVNPKIDEQYEQVNSIKNGLYKSYFLNGKVYSEGAFLNGLYNGPWTYYYSNGNVKAKGSFIAGHGTDISETSGLPLNGRDGLWKIYHDNGKLSQEASFLKGKRNGGFKAYNAVGVLTEESTYKNEVLDGKLVKYNNQAIKISEANFIMGIVEGEEKIYYDSGNLKIQRAYKQGKLDGVVKVFYENGNLKETKSFINGIDDGLTKLYFENGNIKYEAIVKNGREHGSIKKYFENGKIEYKCTKDTNSLAEYNYIGEYFEYNDDGTLKRKLMFYKDGRVEDLTPKPESKLSKTELAKVYRCICCKGSINGIMEGVSEDGSECLTFWLEFIYNMYSDNPSVYVLMRSSYPFCTMKCARTCSD